MLRKLEVDALKADLSAVDAMLGADDEAVFEEAASELDERLLLTLRQFFQRLDDSGATMRIVDGTRDFLLDRHAVSRARERTHAMEIVERDVEMTGTLYVLPESKRFDLITTVDGQQVPLKGIPLHTSHTSPNCRA